MSAKRLPSNPRVAVVGATGAVGRVILDILLERSFPASEVRAIATARSAGTKIPFGDSALTVLEISEEALEGADLVLLDTPDEAALQWAPIAVDKGAIVADNSAAWRMEESVPLVVPEINPHDIDWHSGILASANCTTIGVVVPLFALHREFGLVSALVSSYQAVSGAGRPGVEELREQALKVVDDLDSLGLGNYTGPDPKTFSEPVAFNVVPLVGSEREGGFTGEEWKLRFEARKIMGLPDLEISGTCVRVPSVAGHGSSVHATFESEVSAKAATDVLGKAPGVELTDVPTALLAAGRDPCFVGRVRQDPDDPRSIWFFTTSDNLRKGAALNTVQIAELLLP